MNTYMMIKIKMLPFYDGTSLVKVVRIVILHYYDTVLLHAMTDIDAFWLQ